MSDRGSGRVLVVDDDRSVLQVYSRILGRAGYQVTEVAEPVAVFALLQQSQDYDVVVTDLHMPGCNGVELMRRLRAEFSDRPWLQLIVITGNASLESAIDSLRLDASEYLQKPVSAMDLTRAVSRASLRAEAGRILGPRVERTEYLDRLKEVAEVAGQLVGQIRGLEHLPDLSVPANADARAPGAAAEGSSRVFGSKASTLKFIWQLQETRREVFRGSSLPESSWDILTELMSIELASRKISVSGLCLAANCPVTTALRRIDELTELGLIAKDPDPSDARRLYVRMTDVGRAKMEEFLEQVAQGLTATNA
jgi:CheY-like chemotaxis protein/DNA-binding MarR family transcriptional regulator